MTITNLMHLPNELYLISSGIQVSFTLEDFLECALVLINHDVNQDFHDQAEVIAYAGNNFDFGEWKWGRPYEVSSVELAG